MTREEATEKLQSYAYNSWGELSEAFKTAIEVLKQPERTHTHWIGYETSAYNGIGDFGEVKWIPKKFFRCGICRKGTAVKSRYCPNCGAIMDENFPPSE